MADACNFDGSTIPSVETRFALEAWRPILITSAFMFLLRVGWSVMETLWWKPMRIARKMKSQGITVRPYRLLGGDLLEMVMLAKAAQLQPMTTISHDIVPRIFPALSRRLESHGNTLNVFWQGTAAPTLNVTDPEMVKDVMSTNSSCFHRAALEVRVLRNFLGNSIFTVEGDAWAHHRRIINSGFLTEKLKVMLEAIVTSANELMKRWETLEDKNSSFEVDVSHEFCNLSMDIFTRTAFCNSPYEQGKKFGVLQKDLQTILMSPRHILAAVIFPSYRLIPIPDNRHAHGIRENMDKIVREMIEERIERAAQSQSYGSDLLGSLLSETDIGNREIKGNKKLSTNDVISEFHSIFLAGNESNANLLAWTLMLLSLHPEWQERARKEVVEICNGSPIDDEKLRAFKILTTILQETLRLYPAVCELTRIAVKSTTVGKLSIPEGLQVWMPILQLHRNPEQWGQDALDFKPDRFAEGAAKACKNPYSYIPFSCGQRSCVGQAFAMMEAKVVLATLLQRYSFQLSPNYRHSPTASGALKPRYGMPVIFQRLK